MFLWVFIVIYRRRLRVAWVIKQCLKMELLCMVTVNEHILYFKGHPPQDTFNQMKTTYVIANCNNTHINQNLLLNTPCMCFHGLMNLDCTSG